MRRSFRALLVALALTTPIASAQENPHGGDAIHRAQLPESGSHESRELPPGVVVVRVVDSHGTPIPEVSVRVGAMREGEPAGAQEIRTGPDGTARIERMITDGSVAYRLSTEHEGARFGAPPFQLPSTAGYEVQIVRHAVSRSPRAILVWDARAELRFKDERLVVVMRVKLVNLTAMSLNNEATEPSTFVPENGLRFGLPAGFTAFTAAPSMSDQHLVEENGAVVFRGSIPPTTSAAMELVYQFQLKLHGGDVDFRTSFPLPVVSSSVIAEAPPGLTLSVEGMPPAENREGGGERVLLTGLERRPDDPPLRELHVRLGGIPAAAGPVRLVATTVAAALVLGAIGYGLSRRRASTKRSRDEVNTEKTRVLAEMTELSQWHRDGVVGPITYDRRRRELALDLAALLKELDEATA